MADAVQSEMSLGEHLEELRTRLIRSLLGVAALLCVALYFGDAILLWLCQPLHNAQRDAGLPAQTIGLGVTTGFAIWIKVCLISALIVAAPWIVFQVWRFVESGLYTHERRAALVVAPFSGFMTLLGVMFSYYVMLPVCLAFLLTFTVNLPTAPVNTHRPLAFLTDYVQSYADKDDAGDETIDRPATSGLIDRVPVLEADPAAPQDGDIWVNRARGELRLSMDGRVYSITLATATALTPLIEVGAYINFVLFMTLGVVIGFQLPPVMLVAGWSGLVKPSLIARYRSYCVFVCFILGAALTPADPVSMLVLALPLWALFEIGLLLMRATAKKS